jgi:hypothetical protein
MRLDCLPGTHDPGKAKFVEGFAEPCLRRLAIRSGSIADQCVAQRFELEAENDGPAEWIALDAVPAVGVVKGVEVVGRVACHVDVDLLEPKSVWVARHRAMPSMISG